MGAPLCAGEFMGIHVRLCAIEMRSLHERRLGAQSRAAESPGPLELFLGAQLKVGEILDIYEQLCASEIRDIHAWRSTRSCARSRCGAPTSGSWECSRAPP